MKKTVAILLVLVLLLSAGCSKKTVQQASAAPETTVPETTVSETTAPETTAPETTEPETVPPQPKLETGTVQGDNVPAILWLLNRGDSVEVTANAGDGTVTVKIDGGTGTMEAQLLRFAGEEAPESWVAYARWNTGLYGSYEMSGEPDMILKTNTKLEILEELDECYMVTVDGETGFVAKDQVSQWPVSGSSGGSSGGKDGGDIEMAYCGGIQLLSDVTKTGSAQVRVDGAKVILKYFNYGDTVQIVAEEGFAPELPGYLTILVDDTYAYIPLSWVHRDADPAFESWEGYAGYGCQLYDNYLLRGTPVKQLSANTPLTVLWEAGDVLVVRAGDTVGCVSADTVRTTRLPAGSGSSNSGSNEWTPPCL